MKAPGLSGGRPSPLVGPVHGRIVTARWAERVVSPLHDVLSEPERRAMLAVHPDSYLHVTSDPLVSPGRPGDTPADAAQAGAIRRLLDRGAYRCLREPAFFVYQMREGHSQHTGVVASVDLAGFADGSVLGHERVQPPRVESLLRHYEHVPLRSELVTLIHRSDPAVAEVVQDVCRRRPLLELTDVLGTRQSVWQAGPEESATLTRSLDSHRHYIADGHHRVAAALQGWERDGRPQDRSVLCALYSEDQIVLHAFHRRVRGPVRAPGLLETLGAGFDVRPATGPDHRSGAVGLYAAGSWHVLTPRKRSSGTGVAALDVTMLEDHVLRPILDVRDGDPRLEFVPDLKDLQLTTRACDDDGGVLFTLQAPSVEDLVSVAERREVMSVKSTYVRPKPRTGIFLQ
jgi:uncharacterized protein (DUF1015 family)